MKVAGIIPARLASSRFPRKPLTKIHGHSMIEHVYKRAQCAKLIDDLYIATCDDEIAAEAKRFGAKAIMTSSEHVRGTDRVAEAAKSVQADVIINIQGDEPMVCPEDLDATLEMMRRARHVQCVNGISMIKKWDEFINPSVVKTVTDPAGRVLYFSRQPVPHTTKERFTTAYRQLGIYFFQRDLLLQFSTWEETPLEKAEAIDMLRFVERGIPVFTQVSKHIVGVDHPEDVPLVETALAGDKWHQQIFAC